MSTAAEYFDTRSEMPRRGRRRARERAHTGRSLAKPCPDPRVSDDLIGAGLKVLDRKHHPDAGGDTTMTQVVNNVADWLRDRVRGRAA